MALGIILVLFPWEWYFFLFPWESFCLLKLSPSLFLFGPKSVFFFFLENCSIFCPYSSIFSQFLAQKILLFFLGSAPACFFGLKSFFFFLKIVQFLAIILKFYPILGPENPFSLFLEHSPSLFFWPEKSFFSFSHFLPKKSCVFCSSSAPACFFWPENSFFL